MEEKQATSEKTQTGCLLIHGFTGSPFEMEPLRISLEKRGVEVSVPLLPGHGTTLEEMDTTRFLDWEKAVDEAYDALSKRLGRKAHIFVGGLSMGGSLALNLAARRAVAGVVAIAAPMTLYMPGKPFHLRNWQLPFLPIMKKIKPLWPSGPANEKAREIAPWIGYDKATPLNATASLMEGLKVVRQRLRHITAPVLLIQARDDRTVSLKNAHTIMKLLKTENKRLLMVDIRERVTNHHVLTTHRETKDFVCRSVISFIDQNCREE